MKRIVAIHQARMTSKRLPGKVLMELDGRPLIDYSLERLKRAQSLDKIVVATTVNAADDSIVDYCKMRGFFFYRGDEKDVLSRYYEAAKLFNAEVVIRTTSDCPLLDPSLIERVIKEYFDEKVDYASNMLNETFPLGLSVEAFSIEALEKAYNGASKDFEREHVTLYINRNPDEFSLHSVEQKENLSYLRWTVDTPEDFLFIQKVISKLRNKDRPYEMETILEILNENPEFIEINRKIKQKGIMD